jgi:membrane-associated phospholipid phosphatase
MSAEYISPPAAYRRDPGTAPGPTEPLLLAGLCLLLLALIWVVAALVPATHFRDAVVLHDFTLLSRPRVDTAANDLLRLFEPAPYVVFGAVLVAVALARREWRVALAVALVMSMAPLSADLLKPLLAHAHTQTSGISMARASWPSGHSTAAAALVLCAALVSPARLRLLVALLGGLFALAIGSSLLILAWHMPSDVVGGYFLAALWFALALAGLRAWPGGSRPPRHDPKSAAR